MATRRRIRASNRAPRKHAPHFTRANVRQLVDGWGGVYALLASNGYINYVGMSRNLKARLWRHLKTGDIPAARFKTWLFREDMAAARDFKKTLIKRFEPYYNQ